MKKFLLLFEILALSLFSFSTFASSELFEKINLAKEKACFNSYSNRCSYGEDTGIKYATEIQKMMDTTQNEEERYILVPLIFGGMYMYDIYNPDWKGAGDYTTICDEQGIFVDSSSYKYLNSFQKFTQNNINLECLTKKFMGDFISNTDECILMRRKYKDTRAPACFFDYKKFLPNSAKVENDDDFIYLARGAMFYMWHEYCKNKPELLTTERKECQVKAEKFLKQLAQKTAPHCRDAIPEQYKNFLSEVHLTKQDAQNPKYLANSVYTIPLKETKIYNLQKLGFENFCSVQGWEDDLGGRSSSSSQSKKSNSSIRWILTWWL